METELTDHLCELENMLNKKDVRASAEELEELLADKFLELGVSGTIWTKQSVIEALKTETFLERSISDFKLTMLADNIALVMYRGHRNATKELPASESLCSSIWKRFGTKWKMVFHQGTPLV